jgi:hypothetical protein
MEIIIMSMCKLSEGWKYGGRKTFTNSQPISLMATKSYLLLTTIQVLIFQNGYGAKW